MEKRRVEEHAGGQAAEGKSLVAAAAQLFGRTERQQESGRKRRAGRPGANENGAFAFRRACADGYVRRSPVQMVKEKPVYRRKKALKAVRLALFLAFLAALVYLAAQCGILAF